MKMNINKTVYGMGFVAVMLMVFISIPQIIFAQETDKPTASAGIGIFSKYIWRGYELSKDSIVIQPSVTVNYKGFGMNLWGNLDTDYYPYDATDAPNQSEFSETDLTFSYGRSFGMVSTGIGYIYYGLDGDDTEELYLSVGLNILLAPTLTIYREVSILPQWYISLGVSHSFELPKKITLDIAGSISYNAADDDVLVKVDSNLNPTTEKYKSFHNGFISVGFTIPIGEYFSCSPMVAYSFPLTDDAKYFISATNNGLGFSKDSDYFYGGITFSLSF